MTNDVQQLQATLDSVLRTAQAPFYNRADFWEFLISLVVGLIVGGLSIYYAYNAYVEAGEAKKAAREAGKTVKYQTVAIELVELQQKLESPGFDIRFEVARDRLSETTKRLHRILSPFEDDPQLKDKIATLWALLSTTKGSLNAVLPDDLNKIEAPQATYRAIEGHFAAICDSVGGLVGLFEQKTTHFGGADGI
jgi:hypothetical protein